jgi:hypothetical protein
MRAWTGLERSSRSGRCAAGWLALTAETTSPCRQTRIGLMVSASKSVNHGTEESAANCSVIARSTSPKHLSSSGSVASASSERLSVMLAFPSSVARSQDAFSASRAATNSASSVWIRDSNATRSSSPETGDSKSELLVIDDRELTNQQSSLLGERINMSEENFYLRTIAAARRCRNREKDKKLDWPKVRVHRPASPQLSLVASTRIW